MYRSMADDTISPLRIGAGSVALGLHLIAFGVLLIMLAFRVRKFKRPAAA